MGFKAFVRVANGAVALVTIEALSSFGESGDNWSNLTVEPILKWTTTNGEVTITDCNEAATGELVIPNTIGGNAVTSIGGSAFYGCTNLTSIKIPDGVTSIGNGAFDSCASLTSITIPDGVPSIGDYAFYGCTSLTSITIPDGVPSIGEGAFNGCRSLTSITIPNSVTSIESYAFRNCTSMTSIIFQGDAPTVGNEAFTGSRGEFGVADGAVAVVTIEDQTSFGDLGADWNGLTVSMSVSDTITALNAQNAAVATARTAGQGDVTSDPASYNLTTTEFYNTVVAERDARPTQTAYDTAVAESRTAGRSDVTSTPASYNLTTSEAYNTIVAERDGRFLDTDKDGITDVKEVELETDSAEETIFYLQDAYDSAVAASRLAGQGDVTANPATFALITLAAYNGMVAQKDNQYNALEEQRVTEAQQLNGIIETRNNTISSNTTTIGSLNETIAQKNTAYATVVAERDARPTQVSYNTVVAERDARPTQEQCDTEATEARLAGRNEVTTSPAAYQLISISTYNTAVAERDARPTAEQLASVEAERDARPTQTSYNTVVAERNARPTEEAYNALIAERDARPTIEEVKDARLGSVVLQSDVANQSVKIRFSIEETDDFRTWTKRDEINEITVPLEVGKRFYRFALEDE